MTGSTSNGKMKYHRTATIHRDRYYFLYLEIWIKVSVPVQIKSSKYLETFARYEYCSSSRHKSSSGLSVNISLFIMVSLYPPY